MVGYVSFEEQVDADFSHARRRAFLRSILTRLRKDPSFNRLPCFEEVRRQVGAAGGVRLGRRTVRLTNIVGSVSRCSEFDSAFLPLRESARTKWERIDRAFHRGEELPPVELYRIGEEYFVNDGNHRVSVARYQGVEFIDAYVTEFRAQSDTPPPLEPTRPQTIEETKEHTIPNKPLGREGPKERENALPAEGLNVRWGLCEDAEAIAELMELNGMCRPLAFEEQFMVAERGGKVMGALRYRTEPKLLMLGLLISDPWAEERPLAVALYPGAGELAREMGVREVRAHSVLHAGDYPYEAGYRWRYPGGWYLDATRPLCRREGLPAGRWRRGWSPCWASPPFRSFVSSAEGGDGWTGRSDRGRDDEILRSVVGGPKGQRYSEESPERRTEDVPDGPPTVEADARADGARRAEKSPAQRAACSSQAARRLGIGPGSNINQNIPPATEAKTTEHKERSDELQKEPVVEQ
jgi:hypothetical protein